MRESFLRERNKRGRVPVRDSTKREWDAHAEKESQVLYVNANG